MTEPYENLANAIVFLAVKDWRGAMGKLKKRPRHKPALKKKEECELFFRSEWFEELTGVEGSIILRKLKEEEGINDE